MSAHKKLNLYWSERHQKALDAAFQHLTSAGIPCERDGKANASAIILYALQQVAKVKAKDG